MQFSFWESYFRKNPQNLSWKMLIWKYIILFCRVRQKLYYDGLRRQRRHYSSTLCSSFRADSIQDLPILAGKCFDFPLEIFLSTPENIEKRFDGFSYMSKGFRVVTRRSLSLVRNVIMKCIGTGVHCLFWTGSGSLNPFQPYLCY